MSYKTRTIITDLNGKAVPQFFNESSDQFEVITGRDGANMFVALGTISAESWSGDTDIVKTFDDVRYGFSIVNDGDQDIRFVIDGNERIVKTFEAYNGLFEPFDEVSIFANASYRAEVLK